MLAYILMLGGLLWIVSELMELVSGGFTPLNSTVSTIAFGAIAVGICALWAAKSQNIIGRIGVGLLALGMVLFALVALQTIGSGLANDAGQADTPLFLAAGSAVSLGALAVSYWLVTASAISKKIGVILLVGTLFTLGVAFVPALVGLQPVSNIILAAVLCWLGWQSRQS